ncbi:MAG: YggS family pyridoxal phosphate-dependent enzyme [Tannerellaceae bacterium]|nr:YggS family pyridoxal phosphate-dependent enzyme [Tannerellaceae bacterium]
MSIADNLQRLRSELPSGVKLIAVSKYQPVSSVREAYAAGQRVFGENRAQELEEKHRQLPRDIEWHFIGSLQTNKVKVIAPYVHTIHSIDSQHLLEEVSRQAAKQGRVIQVLLQLHLAREATKHGMSEEECRAVVSGFRPEDNPWVRIAGLMCMASLTEDRERIRQEFGQLRRLFEGIRREFVERPYFRELSMGMSQDYGEALLEGSTMVRIGTAVFGGR